MTLFFLIFRESFSSLVTFSFVGYCFLFHLAPNLRLSSTTEHQQDARESVDAWRVHRESGDDHSDWTAGNGQDASGDGTGNQGVSDGKEGEVLSSDRLDYANVGSDAGEATLANEEESGIAGCADT